MEQTDLRYLKSLAKQYPTVAAAATEIINLQAILSLPKGTEHFITDIHGEYDQFQHVLKNGSGAIKRKIEDEFGNAISQAEKKSIATLIYYPEQKMEQVIKTEENMEDWYRVTLYRLIRICKGASSKYTRSKVRKALPKDFAYVIEELLTGRPDVSDQEAYYNEIIHSVIRTGRAAELVVAFCNLIRRLVVDHLHVVGDIFDRGPYPNLIMDTLMSHHSVDIQWGNHDISWMGAAAGNQALICNVIRISAKYGNLNLLEDGYGINLVPLARLAMNRYDKDPCSCFKLDYREEEYDVRDAMLDEKMHKAIAIMQFKLEGQMIVGHPEFGMENRLLLDKIDLAAGTVLIEGKKYPLRDLNFPTIDWEHPYELTDGEKEVVERLSSAFRNCEKLQNHMQLLLDKGGLYKTYNGNLLFHGSIPLNEDGTLKEVEIYGETCKGKALYDKLEAYVRKAFFTVDEKEKKASQDILWYIWAGPNSPLYGKDKMTTFERYFIADKETHKEKKNAYYHLWEKEEVVNRMLEEFGLDPDEGHIINGHVPVHQLEGENPVKCDGKVIVIDGGFCEAYRNVTGIAGYTLVYSSYGLSLTAHEPFTSAEDAVETERDIVSNRVAVRYNPRRALVGDTDNGKALKERIQELKQLLDAYRKGVIKEKK